MLDSPKWKRVPRAGARHVPGRSRSEREKDAGIHLDGPVAIGAAAARDVPRSGPARLRVTCFGNTSGGVKNESASSRGAS